MSNEQQSILVTLAEIIQTGKQLKSVIDNSSLGKDIKTCQEAGTKIRSALQLLTDAYTKDLATKCSENKLKVNDIVENAKASALKSLIKDPRK